MNSTEELNYLKQKLTNLETLFCEKHNICEKCMSREKYEYVKYFCIYGDNCYGDDYDRNEDRCKCGSHVFKTCFNCMTIDDKQLLDKFKSDKLKKQKESEKNKLIYDRICIFLVSIVMLFIMILKLEE